MDEQKIERMKEGKITKKELEDLYPIMKSLMTGNSCISGYIASDGQKLSLLQVIIQFIFPDVK